MAAHKHTSLRDSYPFLNDFSGDFYPLLRFLRDSYPLFIKGFCLISILLKEREEYYQPLEAVIEDGCNGEPGDTYTAVHRWLHEALSNITSSIKQLVPLRDL